MAKILGVKWQLCGAFSVLGFVAFATNKGWLVRIGFAVRDCDADIQKIARTGLNVPQSLAVQYFPELGGKDYVS
jgi:hypothetical protein